MLPNLRYIGRSLYAINPQFTTRRFNQTEIEEMAASDRYITLYGKLQDRFGDNGVVSVVIGEIKDDGLHIILWLMSCRVLKRDME